MQEILKYAIYTRVSTDLQAEKEFNSCQAQEAKIKSFIESQEYMGIFKVDYYERGLNKSIRVLNLPSAQTDTFTNKTSPKKHFGV